MLRGVLVTAAVLLASCGQPAEEPRTGVTESEHAYGEEQHPRLLAEFGGAYGDHQAAYVQRVGDRVAASADLDSACTFTLVNSDVVNAFAVPGCYIYITRGLFATVNSEAELASVLGHEIGHIVGQHSQRQERRSLWRSLGVVAAGLTGSERLTRLAGQAAQYFTQRYSRSQEYEADELGVRYLQSAGYDVFATAEMLGALGRNEAFMARTRGQGDARSIPEWALSHPLTQHRVDHATDIALKTGVANDALPENEAAYLREVDGLLYGDDPEQGFVIGQQFAHPMMRIGFEAPPGFFLTNSPQAIRLSGPNGVRGEFGGGRLPPNGIEAYAEALAVNVAANAPATLVSARRRTVNGLSAAIVTVAIQSANGPVPLSIAAYDGGDGAAYHFVAISPAGPDNQAALDRLFDSFHRLSDDQVARLRPRVIRPVPVRAGDTIAELASRTDDPAPQELFMMLNGLVLNQKLHSAGTLKIVTYRPVAQPPPRRAM